MLLKRLKIAVSYLIKGIDLDSFSWKKDSHQEVKMETINCRVSLKISSKFLMCVCKCLKSQYGKVK